MRLEEGEKYEFAYDQHTGTCSVYVKGIEKSDDGTYKCKVENDFGASTQQCEMSVELRNGLDFFTVSSPFHAFIPQDFITPSFNI